MQDGAAASGNGGHGTSKMPPMCGQVLQKRAEGGTPSAARGARRSPSGTQGGGLPHHPGARPIRPAPPPQAAGHAAAPGEEEEASEAALKAGGAAHQGSVPAKLAPLAPLWAPVGAGSPHPMAPTHPGDLAAPADPAAMPIRDS